MDIAERLAELPDRPIFVVGCARSGTTMLQMMIHAHSRLAMPPETRFLLALFADRAQFGDLVEATNVDRVADFIIDQRASRFHELDLDGAKVRELLHAAPATMGSLIGTVFEAYATEHGKVRWGDKRPWYIHHVNRLLALFPDAQIVHIVRDGRDTTASLLNMPWYKRGFTAAVLRWVRAMEMGDHLRQTLASDQYHEFRYEDLVADPEVQLRGLCGFLGEEFEPSMLEYHSRSQQSDWKTWHTNTLGPVTNTAMQRWRSDLMGSQVRFIETVGGSHLEAHGYELSLSRWKRHIPRESRRVWRDYVSERDASDARRHRAEATRLSDHQFPIAAALTRQQRAQADKDGWLQLVERHP